MLQLRKPPMHKVDGAAVLVSPSDSCWDLSMLAADRLIYEANALKRVQDAAVAEFIEANPDRVIADEELDAVRAARSLSVEEAAEACALSPFHRYRIGLTRFQLSTPDWRADGTPCTVRDFFAKKPDAEFGLRRLEPREYHEIMDEPTTRTRLVAAGTAGLRFVKSEGYSWKAKGDERASEEVLEVLFDAAPDLILEIGGAVLSLSRALDADEGRP